MATIETEIRVQTSGADEGSYAQAIADDFLRLRGRGISLSSVDMELVTKWFELGVPLFIPLNAMADVEEYMQRGGLEPGAGRAGSRPSASRIRGLAYIQEEVEARFGEWLEGRVGAH